LKDFRGTKKPAAAQAGAGFFIEAPLGLVGNGTEVITWCLIFESAALF